MTNLLLNEESSKGISLCSCLMTRNIPNGTREIIRSCSWMQDLIYNHTARQNKVVGLTDSLLPGSHNSATWDLKDQLGIDFEEEHPKLAHALQRCCPSIMRPWAKCQTHSIIQQLQLGIRYFDLRIAINRENEFHLLHGLVATETLPQVLENVKRFVTNHPFEIVVLDVVHMFGFTREFHNAALMQLINNTLGEHLARPSTFKKSDDDSLPSLNEVWRSSGRVFVFLYEQDCGTLSGLDFCHSIWPRLKYIDSPWLQCSSTDQLLCRSYQVVSRFYPPHAKSARIQALQYVLTPSTSQILLGILSVLLNIVFSPTSLLKLNESAISELTKRADELLAKPNVIILDGWNTTSDSYNYIIQFVIEENRKRLNE